jgi:hypothetical protein
MSFGSKAPPPPPPPAAPPPPPSVDQAKASKMQADEMRRRQGRAATVLSTEQGMLAEKPQTGTRKLLGE